MTNLFALVVISFDQKQPSVAVVAAADVPVVVVDDDDTVVASVVAAAAAEPAVLVVFVGIRKKEYLVFLGRWKMHSMMTTKTEQTILLAMTSKEYIRTQNSIALRKR